MKINELEDVPKEAWSKKKVAAVVVGFVIFLAGSGLLAAILCLNFSLNGNAKVVLAVGESYREKGASATLWGWDFSDQIVVEGEVGTAPGSYEIQYWLNQSVWIQKLIRTVEVCDIAIPELTLLQSKSITLALGAAYVEPGYVAIDKVDGDLTAKVTVQGTVNTAVAGDYTLRYAVTDASGNEARAERVVTVLRGSPLTMSLADFSLDPYFEDVILPKGEDAGESYVKETVFIGDSITQNGLGFGFLPYHNVWARPAIEPGTIHTTPLVIYGGSPEGHDTEMLAIDAMALFKPHRVIINIGTNTTSRTPPDEFARDYGRLIQKFQEVSPETIIVVSAVYPVDKRFDESARTAYLPNNDKCNKINYALAVMCRELGVKLLNVAQSLKDENGQAKQGLLYESDGMHPARTTYPQIMEYIRTHPSM